MSYADGMSAINLEMPTRVPRTEYSADLHWDLVKAVTGIDVNHKSPTETRIDASSAFMKAWNYDFIWDILTYNEAFKGYHTKMGHAEYATGGVDFSNVIGCPFSDPEEVLAFDPWEAYGNIDRET